LGSRDILNCDLFFSPKLVGVGNWNCDRSFYSNTGERIFFKLWLEIFSRPGENRSFKFDYSEWETTWIVIVLFHSNLPHNISNCQVTVLPHRNFDKCILSARNGKVDQIIRGRRWHSSVLDVWLFTADSARLITVW
jgi:hypothetical protein